MADDKDNKLLNEIKNYLEITWDDSLGDEKIRGMVKRGMAAISGKTLRISGEIIRIIDKIHIFEGTCQGSANATVGDPCSPVPVTTVVTIGIWLDTLAEKGIVSSHTQAGDLALVVHAKQTRRHMTLNGEWEDGCALIAPLCRGGTQHNGQHYEAPDRLAGLHGYWFVTRGLTGLRHQRPPQSGFCSRQNQGWHC